MKKVAEILLSSFLRRYPVPTRLNLVSYLGQYVWLKDVLEELRPALFPERSDAETETTAEPATSLQDANILSLLERSEVRGRLGYYKAETYLQPRGRGYLFAGVEITSKRPVIIKEYLLPASDYTKADAQQRQNSFHRLAGLQLADGRSQDFRLIQPIEAIADTASHERCFLVTDARDRAPTLRQQLQTCGTMPVQQVREILSQILQTLDFLHKQKFSFPAGAIQNGLVHGNLSLDSILWTEQHSQPFVYLCDLQLWEQCFDASVQERQSTQVTRDTLQKDLRAVGEIGLTLLQGLDSSQPVRIDPTFQALLDALRTAKFDSAETARRELLQLTPRSPDALAPLEEITAQAPPKHRSFLILGIALAGIVIGAFLLIPKLKLTQARPAPTPKISTCCLAEISAIPSGEYLYTAVTGGSWWNVLQQRDLLQRGKSITSALATTQPKLQLQYVPANSLEEVFKQVRSGSVDFAIMPLLNELPKDLLAQEIAYDGLVTVVSFSYAERERGLPTTLRGQLKLEQVQQLYAGKIDQWKTLGGPPLEVRRYASKNPEAIALFEQRVLKTRKLKQLTTVKQLPSLEMLRQILRDFEDNEVGSVGLTTVSELWGQCSVYPLALSQSGQAAVQPIVLSNGQDIRPETNLCERKGAYGPDAERFQTDKYPLSYPIMVVYPRDNRRSAIGKKFVELMRTIEGQQLLKAAGLVPLSQNLSQQSTRPPGAKGGN